MLPIKTIIRRIRYKLHDTDSITYDDEQILDTINDGLRFIRRSIAKIQPELISTTRTGTVEAGTRSIELEAKPLAIVDILAGDEVEETIVTYDDYLIFYDQIKIREDYRPICAENITVHYKERPLAATNLRHITERKQKGTPVAYWRTGLRTVNFYPIPDKTTAYTVQTVDDIEEVTASDNSPLITDFDDFLIEYVAARLALGNEYDTSQEVQLTSSIYSQIERILAPPPPAVDVQGYWDAPAMTVDYGRRVICG